MWNVIKQPQPSLQTERRSFDYSYTNLPNPYYPYGYRCHQLLSQTGYKSLEKNRIPFHEGSFPVKAYPQRLQQALQLEIGGLTNPRLRTDESYHISAPVVLLKLRGVWVSTWGITPRSVDMSRTLHKFFRQIQLPRHSHTCIHCIKACRIPWYHVPS